MMSTITKPMRWTPSRIRNATPFPKPRGAIDKELEFRGGPDHLIDLDGRHLLAHIIRYADVLDVTTNGKSSAEALWDSEPTRWLLVPMPPKLLHLLEWLGADREDLEDGADDEHDGTHEEPSLGSIGAIDQTAWAADLSAKETDVELDDAEGPEGDDEREPDLGWEHWTPISGPQRPPPSVPAERVMGKPHEHPVLFTFVPL